MPLSPETLTKQRRLTYHEPSCLIHRSATRRPYKVSALNNTEAFLFELAAL